jgi:KUP system potassium uptake protein
MRRWGKMNPIYSITASAKGINMAQAQNLHPHPGSTLALSLAALGIVFGDLGTSPLYALQEAFHGPNGLAATPDNVVGIVSLFLWSLIVMVSLKYVYVLMQADNRGEGGILALMALLVGERSKGNILRKRNWILFALVGTAMLYGDGVITPAISVLSAIEGIEVATPAFHTWVVPLTMVILLALFAIQPFGSGRVGVAFGPILALWFVVIGWLGLVSLCQTPAILAAFNPIVALRFFINNGWHGFLALGAVVLCLTGGEALYADMGHFGRSPISRAWYLLALPALTINYLGQGALLLRNPGAASHPFYSLVPDWAIYPMVILATLATIVAAQALITAVFSLTNQAMRLGLFPHVQIIHTSDDVMGQIYLPALNWMLMAGTLTVVLIFPSSEKLAAAFGLAVSVTMAITTALFAALARSRWHWSALRVALVAGIFMLADLAFVAANALKFVDGGWLSFVIGGTVFLLTFTWFCGRKILSRSRDDSGIAMADFIDSLAISPPHRVYGTAVFLTEQRINVPTVLFHHLKHNQILHETVVMLTLTTSEVPRVADEQRLELESFPLGFIKIVAHFGFMEEPNVPGVLQLAQSRIGTDLSDPMTTSYYLGHETLVVASTGHWWWRALLRLFIWLHRNENDATTELGIPPNRVVEMGARLALAVDGRD